MQTPSTPAGTALELLSADSDELNASPGPGGSLQKILRFELKEDGNHVLAVTVTYTETILAGEGRASGGRVRTFRKLYQFVAQQLLSVRTKTGELTEKAGVPRYLLEAQLENMGEVAVSFEVSDKHELMRSSISNIFGYIHLSLVSLNISVFWHASHCVDLSAMSITHPDSAAKSPGSHSDIPHILHHAIQQPNLFWKTL